MCGRGPLRDRAGGGGRAAVTDKDGYPKVCCMCGHRIVKSHGVPLQFHYDHTTGEARSWHVRCGSPLEVKP